MISTTSLEYFEAKYAGSADPWEFATSRYEQFRYSKILAALNGWQYRRAFEPGCSIGILTRALAQSCGSVEAIDISSAAVAKACEHCKDQGNVFISHGVLPQDIPSGTFDLIVFSEIGYYFDAKSLRKISGELTGRLIPGGIFLAAHWLGNSRDHRLSGDEVHTLLASTPGMERTLAERHDGFRIDRWFRL